MGLMSSQDGMELTLPKTIDEVYDAVLGAGKSLGKIKGESKAMGYITIGCPMRMSPMLNPATLNVTFSKVSDNETKFAIKAVSSHDGTVGLNSASRWQQLFMKTLESHLDGTANQSNSENSSGGGCYIATAVYGSYNCPQVWTLRRYRDNTLRRTWHGRIFIRLYYGISPTIVKVFGKKSWFNRIFKQRLDTMTDKLNGMGVSDAPYHDKRENM